MEESKRYNDRIELARFLSDVSRNSGKVSFVITYTSTKGNIDIDKEFQTFCYEEANNEYLAGISKLLAIKKHYSEMYALNEYVKDLDARIVVLENFVSELTKDAETEVNKENKEDEEATKAF